MSQLTPPSYSAMVSPELVALLRGCAVPVCDPAPAPECTQARETDQHAARDAALSSGPTASAPPVSGPVWQSVRLRRDGMLPLCLEALPLAESEGKTDVVCAGDPYAVTQRVALFVTPAGTVAVQLAFLPPNESPARPVYRAWHVTSAEECSALLESVSAAQCFIVSMQPAQASAGSPRLPFMPADHSKLLN